MTYHLGICGTQSCHKRCVDILSQYRFLFKIEIARCAGIVYDRAPETEIGSCPGRCIDAHMTHGTADHNVFNAGAFKPN